jgi:mannose-6-phosphate isomerase-like protein (cupin superfamily)
MMAKNITVRDMTKRVSRYKKLKPQPWIFVDFALPKGERDILSVIGDGVKDRKSLAIDPAIKKVGSFHVIIVRAKPGHGAALHAHKTEEVFMPLQGKWAVFWGDKGERRVVLDQYDTISVPPGVMRGFVNVGRKPGILHTTLGGKDPGKLTWSRSVLDEVKARGYGLDKEGYLKKLDKPTAKRK